MIRALVVLGLVIVVPGCALSRRPRLTVPAVCPDGAPVKWLQHPACGRSCGYSCLPDRWRQTAATKEQP